MEKWKGNCGLGVEAKKKEKRERLIKAGINLFSLQGFSLTTIEDITSQAGVAKGTFYLYFDDKQQFFAEIIGSMAFQHEENYKRILTISDPRERLKNYIVSELEFYRENANFANYAITVVASDAENFINWYREIQIKHIIFLSQIIAQGHEAGVFAAPDAFRAAQFLQGGVFMFVAKEVLNPEEIPNVEEDADFIVDTFINGVGLASRE